ncbi:MAG TPA: alpha/beta fold hydrolase [Burkholderiales bacterium]|nr:alpha/beta fold hydrolase [Burkholderiales bacterium]
MIRTRYRIDGSGARWVTFVTGIANDLTMWDGQVPALERDFRILRYNLRGHGGSEAMRGDYSVSLLVEDLLALLNQLRVQTTSLVGLGLGGAIAQAFAIEHPERVEALMPCCCRARMVPDFAAMWHKLRATVQQEGLEAIVEPTVQRWFSEEFKAAHPQVLENIRKMVRRTTLEGYMGVTAAFLGLDLEDRLPEIRARTLYVSGAEDKLGGPPELMKGLSEKVNGAKHVSVPKAAHIANIQNPEGFNQLLTDFLRRKQ